MDAQFCELNASVTGTKELKEVLENAKFRFYGLENKTTYVYVDEFHRWNKLQQDSLPALWRRDHPLYRKHYGKPLFFINNAVLSLGARSMNFTGSIRDFAGNPRLCAGGRGTGSEK